jgi:hypothetical protein
LRSKTDQEVVKSLVSIMDARFQDEFVAQAQRAGKLSRSFRPSEAARSNTPAFLADKFRPWRSQGLFGEVPFGTDFTTEELALAKALKSLASRADSTMGKMQLAIYAARVDTGNPKLRPYLERMKLASPTTRAESWQRRLVAVALQQIVAPAK